VLAIDLLDPSSSDKSIKLVSFHPGDGFFFLDLPLARIVSTGISSVHQADRRHRGPALQPQAYPTW
jgi:hypothetical protein